MSDTTQHKLINLIQRAQFPVMIALEGKLYHLEKTDLVAFPGDESGVAMHAGVCVGACGEMNGDLDDVFAEALNTSSVSLAEFWKAAKCKH